MRRSSRALLFGFQFSHSGSIYCLLSLYIDGQVMGRKHVEDTYYDSDDSRSELEMSLSDMERWKELFGAGYIQADGAQLFYCLSYLSI